MAGTILGKRSRASGHSFDKPVSARASKRVHTVQESDENRDPLDADHDPMLLDNRPCSTLPVKVALSPSRGTSALREHSNSIIATPQTPRRRDALSKAGPITPRHRVLVSGRPLTPRTPRTPSTPSATARSVYGDARKVFTRGADPGQLVGREKERSELQTFINERVVSRKGGALYVSGPPGTGKSALVSEVCQTLSTVDCVNYAHINCMSVKNAPDVYSLAASALGISDDVFGDGAREALRASTICKTAKVSYLVVLDEIDQLLNFDLVVLYDLFEWSFAPGSKLILVGIANALDLTDRFLPRLKARNLKPNLLPFLPYTAAEVATVLTARCRSLLPANSVAAPDFTPFLHPAAIQLISKKVASQTGDLRRSFDIAQRAIGLAESEAIDGLARQAAAELTAAQRSPSKTPLGENANLASPRLPPGTPSPSAKPTPVKPCTQLAQLTPETAPRATLAHVVRVTAAAFGSSLVQRFKTLNLQQKAIICALVALEHGNRQAASMPSPQSTPEKESNSGIGGVAKRHASGRAAAPTVRALREAYTLICRRDNILHALSGTEFRDVVANLETASLVAAVDGKAGSLAVAATPTGKRGRGGGGFGGASGDERRISARLGVQDLEAGIEGAGSDILKSILHDDGA